MKRKVIVFASILAALLLYSNQLLFGQTSGLVQKKTTSTSYTDTKLYEFYSSSQGVPPRLLFPYNASTFSSTDFLLDLKVGGTITKGLRLSNSLFSFEVLNLETSYGLYQTGSNYVNYFGSKTAIGGTAAFQPVATLHVKGNGIFTEKLGIGLEVAPVATLQVAGNGIFTDKLGIGLATAPSTQLHIGSLDSITLRFDAANGKEVVMCNTGLLGGYRFYGVSQIENPNKGEGSFINQNVLYADLQCDGGSSASVRGVLRIFKLQSYNVETGHTMTNSLQIPTGAQEGYLLASNARGDATWINPLETALALWQKKDDNTIYTTAPGVVIGDHPVVEKFQVGSLLTFHDGANRKAISYNFNPSTGSPIVTGASSSMEFQSNGNILFKHSTTGSNFQDGLYLGSNGTVGIKTTNTFDYTLAVNGVIGCKEIKVEVSSPWPDYVFLPGYELPTLSEVEGFVAKNGHLPNVPSAQEIANEGVAVGEMQATLLKKVEELTLYMIQQQKAIEQQQNQINELKALLQNK